MSDRAELTSIKDCEGMTHEIFREFALPETATAKICEVPRTGMMGLDITLPKGSEAENEQVIINLYGDRQSENAPQNHILRRFGFVATRNVVLPRAADYTDELFTEPKPQIPHHDIEIEETDHVLYLYHGGVAGNQVARGADTMLSSARVFSDEMLQYLRQWQSHVSEEALDNRYLKVLYECIKNPNRNSHALDDFPALDLAGARVLHLNLKEWGYENGSFEEKLLRIYERLSRLVNTGRHEDKDVRDLLDHFMSQYDHMAYFSWTQNTLLGINNRMTVHGVASPPPGFSGVVREKGLVKLSNKNVIGKNLSHYV